MLTKLKNNININIANFKKLNNTNKCLSVLSVFLLLFCMVCCGILCSKMMVIYLDDVMYADMTQHGFNHFIEQNLWHMQNYNGRTFIHLCLQFVTIFQEYLYSILMPFFLTIPFFLFFKNIRKDASLKSGLFASSTSILLFFMLGYLFLYGTLMWMAGAFNYIFPLFIVSIAYSLFLKNKSKDKVSIITLLLLFISGATTEQYGLFSIGLIVLTLFFDFIDKIKIRKNAFRYLLPTVIGYTTIFMAKGTFDRIVHSNGYVTRTDASFWDMFLNNCKHTIGGYGNILIVLIFFVLIGCMAIGKKTKYSKLCITAIPVAIISLLLYYTTYLYIVYILFNIELIVLCIALCLKKETREQGKLLICGTGTFFMMNITLATGTRTSLPFMLCVCIIISVLLYDLSKKVNKKMISVFGIILLLMVSYMGSYSMLIDGYSNVKNNVNETYNQLDNAKHTKKIVVNYDDVMATKDYKYRYVMLFDTPFKAQQQAFYYNYFDIPIDTKITFTSEQYNVSSLCVNDKYSYNPAININNEVYIPYTFISALKLENFDGSTYTDISYNNRRYVFNTRESKLLIYDNNLNNPTKTIDVNLYTMKQYGGNNTYIKIEDFCKWLDLKYSYNEKENVYCITEN